MRVRTTPWRDGDREPPRIFTASTRMPIIPPRPACGERIEVRGCVKRFSEKEVMVRISVVDRARSLRKKPTEPERILWRHLRNRNFAGYKFRRQHPIDGYVLDFYCASVKLTVELDGGGHNYRPGQIHDRARSKFLAWPGSCCVEILESSGSPGSRQRVASNLDGTSRSAARQSLTLVLSL